MANIQTKIICRLNSTNNHPIVFLVDTIDYAKNEITALNGEKLLDRAVHTLPSYQKTLPLSTDDEKMVVERYKAVSGDDNPEVRHKMPRRHATVLPNVLTAKPAGDEKPADVPTNTAGAPNFRDELEAIRQEFNDRFIMLIAKVAGTTKPA